jgi:hypothetical protein
MSRRRRVWRAMMIAVVGAGALSGCYYDPYTGYWYGYPPYPYPWAYPYASGYPYPYPPPANPAPGSNPRQGSNPAQGYGPPAGPPENAPIQQTPLPPPSY